MGTRNAKLGLLAFFYATTAYWTMFVTAVYIASQATQTALVTLAIVLACSCLFPAVMTLSVLGRHVRVSV